MDVHVLVCVSQVQSSPGLHGLSVLFRVVAGTGTEPGVRSEPTEPPSSSVPVTYSPVVRREQCY